MGICRWLHDAGVAVLLADVAVEGGIIVGLCTGIDAGLVGGVLGVVVDELSAAIYGALVVCNIEVAFNAAIDALVAADWGI